jgi:hypothetical protein
VLALLIVIPQLSDKINIKLATNFEECVALGNPIMKSYPRQCRFGETTFTEDTRPPVACTMEAKLCSDGSYVSRTGPNCEFSACPTVATTSTVNVSGVVTLGPTCPVMRNPPDPQCADRPYVTTVQVIEVGSPKSSPFATAKTDAMGQYSVNLPPGSYALQPIGGNTLPRCETKEVTVVEGVSQKVNLSCDTGIR